MIESDGPTGPSTVLRVIDHPDIDLRRQVHRQQPRAVGTVRPRLHPGRRRPRAPARAQPARDADLAPGRRRTGRICSRRCVPRSGTSGRRPVRRRTRTAWWRCSPKSCGATPASPHLRLAHHDVPTHAPDLVAHVLAGLRGRRGTVSPPLARHNRWSRQPVTDDDDAHVPGRTEAGQPWCGRPVVGQRHRARDRTSPPGRSTRARTRSGSRSSSSRDCSTPPSGDPEVTVTFDDGNLSDLEIGLPRLLERGLRGPLLRPGGAAGRAGPAR